MVDSDSSYLFLFGDNHLHPRDEVRDRLRSVIPEEAEAMIIEHPVKSPHKTDVSRWVYLKNPSMWLVQVFAQLLTLSSRRKSDRVIWPQEETVAEEVAGDLGLTVEYTDIPARQRFENQPFWLTSVSWTAVLLLFLGWRVALWIPLVGLFSVPSVALITQRVFHQMREAYMAEDCIEAVSQHGMSLVFVGDSHVEPLVERLQGHVGLVLGERSRPD